MIAWRSDGTETMAEVSSNITGRVGRVFVYDAYIVVNKITVWRTER